MRVLVTGGAGFIGRRVVLRLAEVGHAPVVFDRALDPADDVTDLARVRQALAGCDTVVHLAAKVGLGLDIDDIDDYVTQNDVGTAVVLRAAANAGTARVAYASSMVVYGEGAYTCPVHGPTSPPPRRVADLEAGRFDPLCPRCGSDLVPGLVPEGAPLDPRNVYAATKAQGEYLAAAWCRETEGSVAALRFHNVYGPGMPRNTPYAGVASLFASAIARGEAPRVFEDGGQRRNFVHVDDVAAAVVASLEADLAPGVTPLNIGSPDVTTVGRMAEVLSEELDGPAPVVTGQFRLGDVRHITADCTAAERVLGWRAERPLSSIAELAGS
ncbi:dTDP-L-rhamnose 4-epimerase [Microlunatus sagamiharensis]|uniref:dTDP-L-rhamnose 4-epimerase n=1 Tax=Microlunatus sagamiharensis TaxID=546874 RepID=A0A1H2NA20_9ACTN|nr:NAD-dependent epimerase/dehydratase family protein [Microlunatus sagamiharensis]SDV02031.1 dTDP-L-rhamnose 4-epimerase [Microlunatus sagamiharensis]